MSLQATSGPNDCSERIKTEHNNQNTCRVCTVKNVAMTNIFDKHNIVERILFCTGIQFTLQDGLPPYICTRCLNNLDIAHSFKTMCMLAADSLQKVTTNIKTEVNCDGGRDDIVDHGGDFQDHGDLTDVQDGIVLKEESEECVREDVKVETVVISDTELADLTSGTKQKKRGPYKKNGKLKKVKKDEQPKVKKKTTSNKKKKDKPDSEDKPTPKWLRCSPCGLVFESRAAADAHREAEHKDQLQYWICEICGQKFIHRGSLSTHTRSHFPPSFPCAQCNYRAAHKYDLTKHQRIHKGERPFQCDMCPASFYDTSNMNSHIRRNHKKQMNFRCEVCGRGFYDRSKLNRHVDSHNNIKRHSCDRCPSAFTRLSYLKSHLRTRHGVCTPPIRPGPPRRHLVVDLPPVEYEKPTLIVTVKKDESPS